MRGWLVATVVLAWFGGFCVGRAIASATVTPEKQAVLDSHGWTAVDEPLIVEPMPSKNGAHCERARVGSSIDNARHRPMIYGRIAPLVLCAAHGRIIHHWADFKHGSPGRSWKRKLPLGYPFQKSYWVRWGGCACKMFRATSRWAWQFGSSDANWWYLDLKITGWVRAGTKHNLTFNKTVRWE
jgi:hypothetical protein